MSDNHERDCEFSKCIGWNIEYTLQPIPDRNHDYTFWHDNYDGADGGDGLWGTAKSIKDAMDQIEEIESEHVWW